MGTLYIVGTPIGNLEDLTERSRVVLGSVVLVAAEDTRVTRRLLNHIQVRTPLISYHAHNWKTRIPTILESLNSGNVALVSDAGMPVISDPGSQLVSRTRAAGHIISVVPGPSAVTTAIAVSGFSGDSFLFLGFLSRRKKDRIEKLESIKTFMDPIVIFEAPHRLLATLKELLNIVGDRHIAICRELTKWYEEIFHGLISEAIDYFDNPRGEFVLVVSGSEVLLNSISDDSNMEAAALELSALKKSGYRAREAVARVTAEYKLPKKTVYQLWLKQDG